LEKVCLDAGLQVPDLVPELPGATLEQPQTPSSLAPPDPERPESTPLHVDTRTSIFAQRDVSPLLEKSEPLDAESQVSGMGAFSIIEESDVNGCVVPYIDGQEYYGSSSAASFLRQAQSSVVNRDLDDPMTDMGQANRPSPSVLLFNSRRPRSQIQLEQLSLPPRPLADHLLQKFWNRVYYLFPFFYRPAFESAYERLWIPAGSVPTLDKKFEIGLGDSDCSENSTIFHCALNAILALGCCFSNSATTEKIAMTRLFFLRAKNLLGTDFIDYNNLGVIQSLLLIALLLQGTPFPRRCWNTVGLATRIAIGLGLHVEEPQGRRTELELEIRRRTWHGCVMLDTYVDELAVQNLEDNPTWLTTRTS
jgi:hypothetical protein